MNRGGMKRRVGGAGGGGRGASIGRGGRRKKGDVTTRVGKKAVMIAGRSDRIKWTWDSPMPARARARARFFSPPPTPPLPAPASHVRPPFNSRRKTPGANERSSAQNCGKLDRCEGPLASPSPPSSPHPPSLLPRTLVFRGEPP